MMLNHNAPAFVPGSSPPAYVTSFDYFYGEPYELITEQDQEELEACDEWVQLVAHLDELEHDHMVALALRHAPAQKVSEIEQRAGFHGRRHHSGKGRAKGVAKKSA